MVALGTGVKFNILGCLCLHIHLEETKVCVAVEVDLMRVRRFAVVLCMVSEAWELEVNDHRKNASDR